MTGLQIAAYALGFGFAASALIVFIVISLDRIADRDAEERKRRNKPKLP